MVWLQVGDEEVVAQGATREEASVNAMTLALQKLEKQSKGGYWKRQTRRNCPGPSADFGSEEETSADSVMRSFGRIFLNLFSKEQTVHEREEEKVIETGEDTLKEPVAESDEFVFQDVVEEKQRDVNSSETAFEKLHKEEEISRFIERHRVRGGTSAGFVLEEDEDKENKQEEDEEEVTEEAGLTAEQEEDSSDSDNAQNYFADLEDEKSETAAFVRSTTPPPTSMLSTLLQNIGMWSKPEEKEAVNLAERPSNVSVEEAFVEENKQEQDSEVKERQEQMIIEVEVERIYKVFWLTSVIYLPEPDSVEQEERRTSTENMRAVTLESTLPKDHSVTDEQMKTVMREATEDVCLEFSLEELNRRDINFWRRLIEHLRRRYNELKETLQTVKLQGRARISALLKHRSLSLPSPRPVLLDLD
ncbi:hypothetical protein WMY93_020528 [Mugilogobius chulae]|uniref:Uncharacterized protein n=1 Tax=Mugilogobius chulae TaxID=88201 RepID=A0AAW0NKE5_9GOBI